MLKRWIDEPDFFSLFNKETAWVKMSKVHQGKRLCDISNLITWSTNLGLFVVKATSDFLSCITLYDRAGSIEISLGDSERSCKGSSLEPRLLFENIASGEVGSFKVWSEQTVTNNLFYFR
jgi:hypothetical protein